MGGKLLRYGLGKDLLGLTATTSNRKTIKTLQNDLRTQASFHGLCSLSAPQISSRVAAFVILKSPYLRRHQWVGYSKLKQMHYDFICNPAIKDVSEETQTEWEECGSYPGIKLQITRPVSIRWEYMNEGLKDFTDLEASGFEARVIQHQVDHIMATDLLRKASAIKIIDPNIEKKQEQKLRALQSEWREKKGEEEFARLRQMLVYSIIEETV